jgi:gas vesicle structural protein
MAGVSLLDGRALVTGRLAALPDEELSVLDLADRLLNRGVVITGEATISVAGVDLIYLGLNVILAATESIAQLEARKK